MEIWRRGYKLLLYSSNTDAGSPINVSAGLGEVGGAAGAVLNHAMEQVRFSARAHDRILKVARTLADLIGKENITSIGMLEAIQFHSLDRQLFV